MSSQKFYSSLRTAKRNEAPCSEGTRCIGHKIIPHGQFKSFGKPLVAFDLNTQLPVNASNASHARCLACRCALAQQLQLTSVITRDAFSLTETREKKSLTIFLDPFRVSVDPSPTQTVW